MPRIAKRLTTVKVNALRKPGLFADGDGLYLQITPTGSKSWVFRYKSNGRARDMGLGPISAVNLAQARERAAECRQQRSAGKDPIEQRKSATVAARAAVAQRTTFREAAEQMLAAHEPGWRHPKHRQQWRNSLANYVYPVIGGISVAAVDKALVLKILEPLWRTKPETATRVRGRIERVLDAAKARGQRDGENPARWRGHLDAVLPRRSKVQTVKHHPALPYKELPAFMSELRERQGLTPRALEFTVLTVARTGEVIGARWEEIDFEEQTWTVPARRMKGGKAHTMPLSRRAAEILHELKHIQMGDFVFPGVKRGKSLSAMAMLMAVHQLRPGVTTHGFRSTFKDWAVEQTSFPNFLTEAALAHVVADKVEAAYRRSDLLERRRELMEAWDRFCNSDSGKLIPWRRRS